VPNGRSHAIPESARTQLRSNLRRSVIDGWFYMVMVGMAETFFPLFILQLYDSKAASGLILTAPTLLAAVLQLGARRLILAMGSYRRAVVLCALVQTFACIPLAAIAWRASEGHLAPVWVTFFVATIYYSGAVVGGPAWTTWLSTLVPEPIRARYFGYRNLMLQTGAIVGVIAGAVALESLAPASTAAATVPSATDRDSQVLKIFAFIFIAACIARGVSSLFLWRHTDVQADPAAEQRMQVSEFTQRVKSNRGVVIIVALVTFQLAVMMAAPFWHAFARDGVGVSFLQWAILIATFYLGKGIGAQVGGLIAKSKGSTALLRISAVGMLAAPALWCLGTSMTWMAVTQLWTGIALASLELAGFLLLVEALPREQRTSSFSKYNVLNSFAGLVGSAGGGVMLPAAGTEAAGSAMNAFIRLFLVSTAARLAAMWLIWRVPPQKSVKLGDAELAAQTE
jgi:MFS family permease